MITKTDALGYLTGFVYDVLGNVTKKTDARGYVTEYAYNADNTLASTTFPDGGIANYAYDNLGRKVSEINPLGNTVTYRYNAFGKVKTMTDPYGYSVETQYDLNGNPVSVKEKRGSVTLYKYDANMRLTEKRIPQDQDASGGTIYSIETYVYDPVGNMTKKSSSSLRDRSFLRETSYTYADNNLLLTVSDTSGAYTKNDYDKNGNVVKTEKLRDSSVYDVEKFVYDVRNRLTQRIRLVEEADLADAASWPNIGNLRDSEYPGYIQVISGYEYDVLGNRTKEIDPRAYAYTPDDMVARDMFAVQYTYDVLNRVEKVIRKYQGADVYRKYTYDKAGNRATERNEQGFETNYTYDGMNRVLTVTDPEQHTFIYGYDLAGNKVTETNAKGYTMSYGYDKLNRLITVTDPYDRVITRNVLDANGNVLKKIDAKGYLSADTDEKRYGWEYAYDLANHLVRVLDPELAMKNKPGSFTWIYEYDPVGEKVKETNALGQTTSYEYNGAGKLVKVTDPIGVSTVYSYDKVGNKLDMTDGRGKLTAYSYGAFGLLRKVTNASRKSIGYKYDLALNIAEMADRNGYHTVYTYDSHSLLTGKTVKETGDRIQYEYDEAGKRITMIDDSGTSRYSYDKNNRLLQIVKDGTERITYTYDAIGNIETVKDLIGFTTSYTYDKSSRMDSVSFQGKITKYQYDDNGNRKAIIYDGGVTEEYSYDRNNRLVNLTNKKPDVSVISSYSYTYNDAGLQTSKTDSFGTTDYSYDDAGRIQQVDAPGKTTVYDYDRAGNRQSLLETYTSAQPSGYVDPSTEANVPYSVKKSEYVYSATNELLKLVETMFDDSGRQVLEKTVSYLYDDNGNELRQQVGYIRPHKKDMRQVTGGSLYGDEQADTALTALIEKVNNTFDGFNRLKQTERLKAGERVTVEYTYDGDDLRTRKTVRSLKDNYAARVTNYLYERQHVILETDAAGTVSVRYVRGINYIARMDASDKVSYYLYNGHGDVVQTVSASGEVENQYDYDVFGNTTLSVETNYTNAIRFAGEFFDAEVGLYYLWARYYNPYTGRFISEDTYEGQIDNPLSLNLYTYVSNNPISFTDPTGHWQEGDENLSSGAQAQINNITQEYNSAVENGASQNELDSIHAKADDIRNSNGYKTVVDSNSQQITVNSDYSTNGSSAYSQSNSSSSYYAANHTEVGGSNQSVNREVGLRTYAESHGGTVNWDEQTRIASVTVNSVTRRFDINDYNVEDGHIKIDPEQIDNAFKARVNLFQHGVNADRDTFKTMTTTFGTENNVVDLGVIYKGGVDYNTSDKVQRIFDKLKLSTNDDPTSVADKLLAHGYNVLYRTEFSNPTGEHAEQINELNKYINQVTHDDEKVNLVGHSKGGLISIGYTAENPNRVDKVITIDTPYQPNAFAQVSVDLMDKAHDVYVNAQSDYDQNGAGVLGWREKKVEATKAIFDKAVIEGTRGSQTV